MNYIKNIFVTLIISSFLFAGQDLESAKVYLKDKDWKKAEEFLLKALDHPKDKWEAAFHLADKIYPRDNDWRKVSQYFAIAETANQSLKIRPTRNDRKIPIKQAILASKARSFQVIYNRAAGFNKLIGTAKTQDQKTKFIEQGIKSAINLRDFDKSQPGGYGLLAQFYILSGDKENALNNIDFLLQLKDISENDMVMFYSFAGEAAQIFSEFTLASKYYEEALLIDPDNLKIKSDIGVLYSRLGQPEKAIQNFLAIIDDIEDEMLKADAHYNLGVSYIKTDDIDEAAYHFEEAFILNPEDEQAIFGMALAFEESQLYRKARKYYREAQRLNPTDTRYQQGISRTQIKEDQEESNN